MTTVLSLQDLQDLARAKGRSGADDALTAEEVEAATRAACRARHCGAAGAGPDRDRGAAGAFPPEEEEHPWEEEKDAGSSGARPGEGRDDSVYPDDGTEHPWDEDKEPEEAPSYLEAYRICPRGLDPEEITYELMHDDEGDFREGSYTDYWQDLQSTYRTRIYEIRFTSGGARYSTYMRINLPDETESGALGVVLLVTGSGGTGVWLTERHGREVISDDDDLAAILATGALPSVTEEVIDDPGTRRTFGRAGPPMVTVAFNRPTRGECGTLPGDDTRIVSTVTTSVEEYAGYAPDNDGDDNCGDVTTDLVEAVMRVALEVVADTYPSRDPKLIVASFSNGAACASRWLRYTEQEAIAYVDCEGPMDSLEQLVVTEALDPFGLLPASVEVGGTEYTNPGVPAAVDYSAWADAQTAREYVARVSEASRGEHGGKDYRDKFGVALRLYLRPPRNILLEMSGDIIRNTAGPRGSAEEYAMHTDQLRLPAIPDLTTCEELPLRQRIATLGVGYLSTLRDYWAERETATHLLCLPCPYVRINGMYDHVQPYHYRCRHAVRGLLAAASSPYLGRDDVYLVDDDYYQSWGDDLLADPVSLQDYDPDETLDADDVDTFPTWPDLVDETGHRAHVRIDVIRWALATFA